MLICTSIHSCYCSCNFPYAQNRTSTVCMKYKQLMTVITGYWPLHPLGPERLVVECERNAASVPEIKGGQNDETRRWKQHRAAVHVSANGFPFRAREEKPQAFCVAERYLHRIWSLARWAAISVFLHSVPVLPLFDYCNLQSAICNLCCEILNVCVKAKKDNKEKAIK